VPVVIRVPALIFLKDLCKLVLMMSKRTRKIVVMMAMVLFATFSLQVILFSHLLSERYHHEHNSKECPVCRQLLTLPRSITVEEQTVISQYSICEQSVIFNFEVVHAISISGLSDSRAPPVVS